MLCQSAKVVAALAAVAICIEGRRIEAGKAGKGNFVADSPASDRQQHS
jgi:hypothetical protein